MNNPTRSTTSNAIHKPAVLIWLFTIWLFSGFIILLITGKTGALLFFSDHRSAIADFAFRWITRAGEIPAWAIVTVIAIFFRPRWAVLIGIAAPIVWFTKDLLKNFFRHDRPFTYFTNLDMLDQIQLVPGVILQTGPTSFPSGHTISAFALYGLIALLAPARLRYIFPLFALCAGVAVSRVYLVQHFWADVYAGSMFGAAIALMVYGLHLLWPHGRAI